MRAKSIAAGLAVAAVLLSALPAVAQQEPLGSQEEQPKFPRDIPANTLPPGASPPKEEYFLEHGYRLEVAGGGLIFPTSMEVGPAGEVYVLESGYSYGPALAIPRVMRLLDNGSFDEVARLPDGPLTGIEFHDGSLYVVGGRAPASVWRVDPQTGANETVVTGFPVWGHHFTSDLAMGPDGKLYFGVGYPSNSGVIGSTDDYYTFGYLSIFPEAHDIPCEGLGLVRTGFTYQTDDPFTPDPNDTATTGVFLPFDNSSEGATPIEGRAPPDCNGALFSVHPNGTGLEVYAQGFRNLFGLEWGPDGKLYGTNHGVDNGGSRPIMWVPDDLWVIEKGGWYGFPDYFGGPFPVTLRGFDPPQRPPPFPALADHPAPPDEALMQIPNSAGVMQIGFAPEEGEFGHHGDLFIAQYGSQFYPERPRGYRVTSFNVTTRTVSDFYVNLVPGPNGTAPERPMDVAWNGNGSTMYVLDFGHLDTNGNVFFPSAATGVLWRVNKTDAPPLPVEVPPPAQLPPPQEVYNVTAVGRGGNFSFKFEDYEQFNPTITLRAGDRVTFRVTNGGGLPHNFRLGPPISNGTTYLHPNETEVFTITVPDGPANATYWCDPHRQLGMFGRYYIVEPNATGFGEGGGGVGGTGSMAPPLVGGGGEEARSPIPFVPPPAAFLAAAAVAMALRGRRRS